MDWDHLIFEGYCTRKYTTKKHKYNQEIISFDPLKTKKILNPDYDPKYRSPRKPSYCKNKVCYTCWEKNCPHLGMSPVDEETHYMFMKAWYKWPEEKADVIKNFTIKGKKFKAYIEKDGKWYCVYEPTTGCATQGETIKEAMKNIKEAVELYLEVE